MARLARFTQRIFGSTAPANEIAQFGSLANSTPNFTTSPSVIQALGNYLTGWFGAVLGVNSPAIEDLNAICYLYAYQLAYLMQAGVSEWDTGTTYYTGSLAQSGGGIVYVSLTNSNIGNALTDSTKWFTPTQVGMMTPNVLPFSAGMSIPSGQTMVYPHLNIGNGQTVTAPSGSNLIGITEIVVSGSGVLQATGSGIIRVI